MYLRTVNVIVLCIFLFHLFLPPINNGRSMVHIWQYSETSNREHSNLQGHAESALVYTLSRKSPLEEDSLYKGWSQRCPYLEVSLYSSLILVQLFLLASTCGNSTACCLVTKPGSLLLPPPPPPPPTHPWRKHAQNTKHLD